jgi:hypothetical protein
MVTGFDSRQTDLQTDRLPDRAPTLVLIVSPLPTAGSKINSHSCIEVQ